MIQELCDAGLFYSFRENNVEVLEKVLLSKDFNINKPIKNFFKAEDYYSYAEIEYCEYIYPVQIMFENQFYFQNEENFLKILQLCIDSGADLNIKQKDGFTLFQMFFIEHGFIRQLIGPKVFLEASCMCLRAGAKVNQKFEGELWEFSYVSHFCFLIDHLFENVLLRIKKHAKNYSKNSFDLVARFQVLLLLFIRRGAYIDYHNLMNRIRTPVLRRIIQNMPLQFLLYCFWKKNIRVFL